MSKMRKQIIRILAACTLITIGLYLYFYYRSLYPETDDAYVSAHISPISAQISGEIKDIYIEDNQYVSYQQPLFSIATERYEQAAREAEAALAIAKQSIHVDSATVDIIKARLRSTEANLMKERKNYHRINALVRSGQASKALGDEANANYQSAVATQNALLKELSKAKYQLGETGDSNPAVMQAQARFDRAQLNLQYAHVQAPASGHITKFKLRRGTAIKAEQPLFYLIEAGCWWIDANFKETQIRQIKRGQLVDIKLDMYPRRILHGYVDSISYGSGSAFSLLPPENATGNWVKVTQRFPVKIRLIDKPDDLALRIGSSADVTIHTRHYLKPIPKTCIKSAISNDQPH